MANAGSTANLSALALIEQSGTPDNAETGKQRIFIDEGDHLMKMVDSSGVVTSVGAGGTSTVEAVWSQIQEIAVSNTTSPTTLVGTGLGSVTLPAGALAAGVVLRIHAVVNVDWATTDPVVYIALTLGGEQVHRSSLELVGGSGSGAIFILDATVKVTTPGATANAHTARLYTDSGGTYAISFGEMNAITIDTTGTLALDLTAEWDTANAGNVATLLMFTAELINP